MSLSALAPYRESSLHVPRHRSLPFAARDWHLCSSCLSLSSPRAPICTLCDSSNDVPVSASAPSHLMFASLCALLHSSLASRRRARVSPCATHHSKAFVRYSPMFIHFQPSVLPALAFHSLATFHYSPRTAQTILPTPDSLLAPRPVRFPHSPNHAHPHLKTAIPFTPTPQNSLSINIGPTLIISYGLVVLNTTMNLGYQLWAARVVCAS